jgi:hypothetical protein
MEMKDTVETTTCERADDLISFLYGEANEQEARDFEEHLQLCRDCRSEFSSFGQVRKSIGLWKEEALSGVLRPQVIEPVRRPSALAALREFFDLSPLWMKGAVGLAAVVFAAMLVLLATRSEPQWMPTGIASDAKYTQQDLDQAVAKALKDQEDKFADEQLAKKQTELIPAKETLRTRRIAPLNRSAQWASRRPLSKSERDQLAADLRLLSAKDEESLSLLGDRINQEF